MKKKNLFIATLLVVAATTVAVVSCKKEKHDQNANDSELIVQTADNMDEYLMAFKKKLLSAEKGGETISLEQAERDLGNLLNFDFGDANYATDEVQYDTLYVPLLVTGSNVDIDQLASSYNTAFANVLNTYNQIELPDKSIFSIICTIVQNAKNSENAIIRLVLVTRGLSHYGSTPIIDETDNWHVWEKRGKCDGTCVGDDHTTVLKKAYNNNRPLLECHNGRIYYTDIDTTNYFHATDFHETNPDIHYNYGYRLWCGMGSEVNDYCIEYPEMRYYYNNLCQIMATEAPRPVGHVTLSIKECTLDCFVSVNPQYFYSFICYYITGKPNCTSVGPAY